MRPLKRPHLKHTISPYLWSFTTYFAEGFPYTIIRSISTVFFRDRGISLEAIGLTSLYGLPWILKFLWGPLVDEYGTKRRWLLGCQALLVLALLITAILAPLRQGPLLIALLFFAASFAAATHDVAIDGYYMEALDDQGQAKFVGYRVMAYRIAMMTGTGVITTVGTTINWPFAFTASALLFGVIFLFHSFFLPECQETTLSFTLLVRRCSRIRHLRWPLLAASIILGFRFFLESTHYKRMRELFPFTAEIGFSGWVGISLLLSLVLVGSMRKRISIWLKRHPEHFYSRAFVSFMDRDRIAVIIFFIIFIRTGEFMLTSMAAPFMVDLGIKVHYGWISGGVGLPCSILGAMLGGWLISRYTLNKMIWPFLLAQNITNLIYMGVALHLKNYLLLNTGAILPTSIGLFNLALVAAIHGFDQLAGGLGTAVLMTFLMRLCRPAFKAAHYAIGTGLMSVSGLYAGVLSGFLASWFGYGYFFGCSFLLSIPGMVLIPLLPSLSLDNS